MPDARSMPSRRSTGYGVHSETPFACRHVLHNRRWLITRARCYTSSYEFAVGAEARPPVDWRIVPCRSSVGRPRIVSPLACYQLAAGTLSDGFRYSLWGLLGGIGRHLAVHLTNLALVYAPLSQAPFNGLPEQMKSTGRTTWKEGPGTDKKPPEDMGTPA